MSITPIPPVASSWVSKTPDVGTSTTSNISSFSVTPEGGSSDMLDMLMSAAVDMDKAEQGRMQRKLQVDITTPEGLIEAGHITHQSLAGVTVFGKLAGIGNTLIQTLIKQQ